MKEYFAQTAHSGVFNNKITYILLQILLVFVHPLCEFGSFVTMIVSNDAKCCPSATDLTSVNLSHRC